jgi:hypothetical protein
MRMMFYGQGEFYNYSGCGNTFNCNHPIVRRFIVDCLRYFFLLSLDLFAKVRAWQLYDK